jgi:hypothetical protein
MTPLALDTLDALDSTASVIGSTVTAYLTPFFMQQKQPEHIVNGNTYFRIRLDPKRLRHARLGRIRLNQLAAANSGSPSPLQLKRSGNAVIDGIVY